MNDSTEKDKIIFRSRELYERCAEKAKLLQCSPNQLARELVKIGLDQGWADGMPVAKAPPHLDEFRALLRKATWCLIVALSPSMDEAEVDHFLRQTFDV